MFPLSQLLIRGSVKVLASVQARRRRGQSPPPAESPQRHFTEVVLSSFHSQESLTHLTSSDSIPQGLLASEGGSSEVNEL